MKNLTKEQIKHKGVIYARENNAELYLIVGKWNKQAKKPNYHWYMVSDKTGIHCVTNTSNRMDERVESHRNGFKINQSN